MCVSGGEGATGHASLALWCRFLVQQDADAREGMWLVLQMGKAMISNITEVRERLNIPNLNMRIGTRTWAFTSLIGDSVSSISSRALSRATIGWREDHLLFREICLKCSAQCPPSHSQTARCTRHVSSRDSRVSCLFCIPGRMRALCRTEVVVSG